MTFYVAELVATGISFLCALTNHAGGCWVWRKLMPLDLWASNVMDARGVNQMHRFRTPPGVTVPSGPPCNCRMGYTALTSGGSGAAQSYHYCPAHGMVKNQ